MNVLGLGRNSGISLLVPTLNAERTVELCIRSFVDFPDEIIVVDNGSTDGTVDIVRRLERDIRKLKFFHVPKLTHLFENRQYALERSQFNWVVRIDSDYVAYTSGPNSISHLRDKILRTKRQVPPIRFGITQVNLFNDFEHTGPSSEETKGAWVPPPVSTLPARIIQHYPGMRFQRLGRWEGIRFQKYLKHVQIEKPYWFHCQFKSEMSLFFRSERTNWRECGDFDQYPTLESYIRDIIPEKYGTSDMEGACQIFIEREIKPSIREYNPEEYYPYPELIKRAMST